jgi:hypothetical protein
MRTFIVACWSLVLLSCHYDVALTAEPTRAADARLAGTWTMAAPEENDKMDIRVYDDRHYVVAYSGDLYRAFHSDVAGLSLMSVQNLNDSERKYLFVEWKLSEDGKRLTVRAVRTEVVPESTHDRDALVKLIEANKDNPKLFGEEAVYAR